MPLKKFFFFLFFSSICNYPIWLAHHKKKLKNIKTLETPSKFKFLHEHIMLSLLVQLIGEKMRTLDKSHGKNLRIVNMWEKCTCIGVGGMW